MILQFETSVQDAENNAFPVETLSVISTGVSMSAGSEVSRRVKVQDRQGGVYPVAWPR